MITGFVLYSVGFLGCAMQFALGIGVTLLTRKPFPRGAYFFGFLTPLVFPVLLGFLYVNFSSTQPCSPANRIGCGDADGIVFPLLAGIFLFNVGVSATIQYVMSRIERRKQGITNEDWKKRDL